MTDAINGAHRAQFGRKGPENTAVLYDGTEVSACGEEWRAFCEARYLLTMPFAERKAHLAGIFRRRGQAAGEKLAALIDDIEPGYILVELPSKSLRQAYLGRYRAVHGEYKTAQLKRRVLDLHEQRKSIQPPEETA